MSGYNSDFKIIKIKNYKFNNKCVVEIQNLILNKYFFLFKAVIVHGSIGTNEVIPFSDFDGLIIVKDNWKNTHELKNFKKESFSIILRFDPLQHHGWFEISESDLLKYPNSYLPISVLKNSKIIYSQTNEFSLRLKLPDSIDYKKQLFLIVNSLDEKLKKKWKPKNIYQLKSHLSQIMLLPCLFYSTIHNKGIFKKNSFDAVKPYFSDDEWNLIILCSKARLNWSYSLNYFQKLIMSRPEKIFRKFTKKFISPAIDKKKYGYVLDNSFDLSLDLFLNKIKKHKLNL